MGISYQCKLLQVVLFDQTEHKPNNPANIEGERDEPMVRYKVVQEFLKKN